MTKDTENQPLRGSLWGVLAITALMVATLGLLGRGGWCKCAGWNPWSTEIYSMHNSQHLADAYSFTHMLHGFVFFAALWLFRKVVSSDSLRLILAVAIEAGWEVLENTPMIIDRYRETTISLDYYGDSITNSVGDVVSCILGYWIASRIRWYYTVAIFVLVESALLLLIRDSLVLNVIMLVYPVDAILQWQTG